VSKLILSLIGHGGSGKTSAANYLQDEYKFTPFSFSLVIRGYAAAHSISLQKRANYASTHAEIIRKYGWDYTLSLALNLKADRICIDDVRSLPYADIIRDAGGKGIAFDCPVETRFAHVHNHPDKAKYPDTLNGFIENEREDEAITIGAGLQFETDLLMQSADYHIDASGSLENTFRQLDEIVQPLLTRR